jgi:hypothetical protein
MTLYIAGIIALRLERNRSDLAVHSHLPPNRIWLNVPRAALRSALGYLLLPLRGGRIDG